MASLNAIRGALAAALNGVGPPGQGIRASADMLASVNPPAAVVTLPPGTSLAWQTMGSAGQPPAAQFTLRVAVLAGGAGEQAAGDQLLDTYLATTGDGSLLAALAANPRLGGAVEWAVAQAIRGYGWVEWAGIPYLGAYLDVLVGVSG